MTVVRAFSIIGSPSPAASKPLADANGLASMPDMKNLASSRLQDLKLPIDRSHTEILKDCDSAHSRLRKRFKMQTQACQQMLDDSDKEYKKMTQRTTESREAMMASYAEFMADAQASASRGILKRTDCTLKFGWFFLFYMIQTQACQQMLDDADREYKKMTQRTTESREAMMASYAELMADAQASASCACKTSIVELQQSFEKTIDAFNSCYGISSKWPLCVCVICPPESLGSKIFFLAIICTLLGIPLSYVASLSCNEDR